MECHKADAFVALEGLVKKAADIKLRGVVFETMLILCKMLAHFCL